MPVIHKAIRPKADYNNPTLCSAKVNDITAHQHSRIAWKNVTCKKCLAKRNKQNKRMNWAIKGWVIENWQNW